MSTLFISCLFILMFINSQAQSNQAKAHSKIFPKTRVILILQLKFNKETRNFNTDCNLKIYIHLVVTYIHCGHVALGL